MRIIDLSLPSEKKIQVEFTSSELKFIADAFGGLSRKEMLEAHASSNMRISSLAFERMLSEDFVMKFTEMVDLNA